MGTQDSGNAILNSDTDTYFSKAYLSNGQNHISTYVEGYLTMNKDGIWFKDLQENNLLNLDISTVREIKMKYSRIIIKTVEDEYFHVSFKHLPFSVGFFERLFPFPFHFETIYTSKYRVYEIQKLQDTWREGFEKFGYHVYISEFANAKAFRDYTFGPTILFIVITISVLVVVASVAFLTALKPSTSNQGSRSTDTTKNNIEIREKTTTTTRAILEPIPSATIPSYAQEVDPNTYDTSYFFIFVSGDVISSDNNASRVVKFESNIVNKSSEVRRFWITISCTGDLGGSSLSAATTAPLSPGESGRFTGTVNLHPNTTDATCSRISVKS